MVYDSALGHGDLREGTGKGSWVDGLFPQVDLEQVINGLLTPNDDIYVYWQGAHLSSLHRMTS